MVMVDDVETKFRALLGRHREALRRVARHYEASAEGRRDLEQEVLLALWRAMPSFRGASSERTWVYRIAHNVAASFVAKAIRTRRDDERAGVQPTPTSPDPLESALERDAMRRLDQRIRALDLTSRQLVLLALEGCTMAEIAEVTGLTLTNVTTRLSRLRRELAAK